MDYEGIGIFCDEDMVVTGDIWELFSHCSKLPEPWDCAVVKSLPRFEWPSVIAFNNKRLTHLTTEYVDDPDNDLFSFEWAQHVAELPEEWNHCCGIQTPKEAKLYHWTQGIPYWLETRGLPEDGIWFKAFEEMVKTEDWVTFHRNTVHFKPVMKRFLEKYGLKMGAA